VEGDRLSPTPAFQTGTRWVSLCIRTEARRARGERREGGERQEYRGSPSGGGGAKPSGGAERREDRGSPTLGGGGAKPSGGDRKPDGGGDKERGK
jgi:hypothetical protein